MAKKKWLSRKLGQHSLHPETLMMGYGYDPFLSERSLKPPVFHTSTFVFKSAQDGKEFFELAYGLREKRPNEEPGLIYSRINNPDLEMLEDRLTIWDKPRRASSSPRAWRRSRRLLWSYVRPGTVLLHSDPVYGGTDFLLKKILPQFGVTSVGFPAEGGIEALAAAAERRASRSARWRFSTSRRPPIRPTASSISKRRARSPTGCAPCRPTIIVDNTMLGPLYQTPLAHGSDLVITSLTKYVGGHSDLIAGSCSGSRARIDPVRGMRTILGTMCDPQTTWMLMRSLETMKLRMDAAVSNARKVAEFLRGHPASNPSGTSGFCRKNIRTAPSSSASAEARDRLSASRSRAAKAEAFAVLDHLEVIKLAVSLGGTESLASHPASMTHSDISADERARLGITASLIRLSVGIENPDDLIADLDQALAALA